ncbi:MAG TPA: NmrA family NAD(P)-binding protein [Acidobacteriaceae bacterium]|jgi:uncharacterized protein YbjT (DUF2867 family)
MFLITGITGHVGGAAAKALLADGRQVRALVRDKGKAAKWADQGVELVEGDWNDAAVLARALEGVEGVYLMMPPMVTPSPGFLEAKRVLAAYVQALKQAPPPKVVALSSMGSEKETGLGLITSTSLMERALGDLPMPVAFVRAGGFFENYMYGLQTGMGGTLPSFYVPTNRKVPMIATVEIGSEVAKLLTSEWTGKRVIELGTATSPDDIAAALGEVLGVPVKAQAMPREAWAAALEGMGLPKGSTGGYEEMLEAVNSGWIGFGVEGTERVAGKTSAKEVFAGAKA